MNVLCLKLRNRHAVWNPATSPPYFEDSIPAELGYSSLQRKLALKGGFHRKKSKPPRKMSPPLPVTEDTPPDMLAGAMDLHVVLPNGQDMKMSVERSTPMMDLLVHITTAHKMSPGGHVIQAIGDRGVLPYKPSTPIGALDTWTVHIVPKKQTGNMYFKKPLLKPPSQNTPFEQTFRLQVNLPRNQLYVSRVSYKTRLEDILREVCKEKNLDQSKYCLVHPEKLDEELDLSHTFLDCKLQQVTLLLKNNRPVVLSSVDIMALKRFDNGNQHVNNKYYASHSYDGSVSSGSLEGRSLSPARSDESSSSPTIPKTHALLNRPFRKRRPAPKPPATQNGQEPKHVSESLTISHSRNSSDSSGYHESSVLSESPESNTNSLADSLPRRSKLPTEHRRGENISQHPMPNSKNGKIGSSLSRSLSNLAVVEDGKKSSRMFLSNGMGRKEYSASSMSLANIAGRKKKAPAPPPPVSRSLLSLKEEDTISGHVSSSTPVEQTSKSQTLPVSAKATTCDAKTDCSNDRLQNTNEEHAPSRTVDSSCSVAQNPPLDVVDCRTAVTETYNSKEKELTMDDEEIDRIFHDATKGYESPCFSALPSPPESLATNGLDKNKINTDDPYNWEYKLPSPPKAFRDQTSSPIVTEYDTMAISNLTDTFNQKRLSADETDKANVVINNLKNNMYNEKCDKAQFAKTSNKIILNGNSYPAEKSKTIFTFESTRTTTSVNRGSQTVEPKIKKNVVRNFENRRINGDDTSGSRTREFDEKRSDSYDRLSLSCDKSSDVDANYMSTNDSGLGSDDSIPSVSEGKSGYKETTNAKRWSIAQTAERRGSTLQNFTISTYQNTKPTEIFHDDSVKTSKTTQLAQSNRPFVKSGEKFAGEKSLTGLSRHSSFNTEKSPNSAIKRSKSHISLLSGNFSKFNRLGKLNINRHSEEAESIFKSSESIHCWEENRAKSRSLPSTASQLRRTTSEFTVSKDSNKDEEEMLELQDQFMKWKEDENKLGLLNNMKNTTELQSLQVLKDILPQINKPQVQDRLSVTSVGTKTKADEVSPADRFKVEVRPKTYVEHVPTVNLQSWNERPKRQVSIKTDRDYVFGNNRMNFESTDRNDYRSGKFDARPGDDNRVRISVNANHESDDLSRVPIVRAVEFKKPFVQQVSSTKCANADDHQRAEQEAPSAEPKSRPHSSYLYGERLPASNFVDEERSRRTEHGQKAADRKEVVCQKSVESRCGSRVSKTQIVFNGSAAPYKPNDGLKRFSYTNGMTNDACATKPENYTFKTYKNKLLEKEKLGNGYASQQPDTEVIMNGNCGRKTVVNLNGEKAAEKKLPFRCFGKTEDEDVATTKSVGIPPPPVMPTLRPVGQKPNGQKTYTNVDPRDVLLSSIKNFNRDNLRKLRVK